jgi:hypothetical protein
LCSNTFFDFLPYLFYIQFHNWSCRGLLQSVLYATGRAGVRAVPAVLVASAAALACIVLQRWPSKMAKAVYAYGFERCFGYLQCKKVKMDGLKV